MAIQARLALSGAADRAVALGGHEQAVAYLRSAATITDAPGERAALLRRPPGRPMLKRSTLTLGPWPRMPCRSPRRPMIEPARASPRPCSARS